LWVFYGRIDTVDPLKSEIVSTDKILSKQKLAEDSVM